MRKKIEEDLSLGEAVKKNYGEGKATEEKSEEENQEKTTHEVKPEEKTGGKKITHPLSEFLKCAVLFHSELSRGTPLRSLVIPNALIVKCLNFCLCCGAVSALT